MIDGLAELRDDELALSIQRGDREAEQELVDRFRGRVFAVALARLGDFDAAEDVCQETLLCAVQALRQGRLEQPDKLGAFLCGTTRNLTNKHLRSREPVHERDPDKLETPDENPEELHQRHELGQVVSRALDQLEPVDQKILLLTLVDGFSSAEVGEMIDRTSATVRQRKHRALIRLRTTLVSLSRQASERH